MNAAPQIRIAAGQLPVLESLARRLAEGAQYDPDELVVDAQWFELSRLRNGVKVVAPRQCLPVPLWTMFRREAQLFLDTFGEEAVVTLLKHA